MKIAAVLFSFLITFQILGHGFGLGTLVKVQGKHTNIEEICIDDDVQSFVLEQGLFNSKVKTKFSFNSSSALKIYVSGTNIVSSPNQKFYLPLYKKWQKAMDLKVGDFLLGSNGLTTITSIETCVGNVELHSILLSNYHTYQVTDQDILVHNGIPVALGITFTIGEKALEFAGATLGLGFLGWMFGKKNKHANIVFNTKAPGKPTENDGYVPPKRWDGKKVRHPKTGQHGYPDRKGRVWVPTGPRGHGGPHWDAVHPNGEDYDNIYPVGHTRKGKK